MAKIISVTETGIEINGVEEFFNSQRNRKETLISAQIERMADEIEDMENIGYGDHGLYIHLREPVPRAESQWENGLSDYL